MIQDPHESILRCTIKKSWQVTKKWTFYAFSSVITILAIYCSVLIFNALWAQGVAVVNILYKQLLEEWKNLNEVISGIVSYISNATSWMPWWGFAGIGFIITSMALIVTYSYLWCLARNLTEEDWESPSAHKEVTFVSIIIGSAMVMTGLASLGVVVSLPSLYADASQPTTALLLLLTLITSMAFFVILCVFGLIFILFATEISHNLKRGTISYYIFRFLGAIEHHHKLQAAADRIEIQEEGEKEP